MVRLYALLLFLVLGACPRDALSGQRATKVAPLIAPILPAEQAWMVTLPLSTSAGPAMDEARVYIPLEGEHFIAIERDTGDTSWMVDIESTWPPLVNDGVVYIAASDELHALDAGNGNHRWRVPLARNAMAPMAFVQGILIVLVSPDQVVAFRPSDGQLLWARALGGAVGPASMAVDSTGAYVALGARLVRVMLADGRIMWDQTLGGQLKNPALARDRVFVGSTTNDFYALSRNKGSLVWQWPFGGDVVGSAATDSLVYVASLDNLLRALKRSNGNQVWKQPLKTRPAEAPRVVDGVVALAGPTSMVTFNAAKGMSLGTYEAPDILQGAPLIDPSPKPFSVSIIAVTRDGRAIGLRPAEMMFHERALDPLTALPGRVLQKEPSPIP